MSLLNEVDAARAEVDSCELRLEEAKEANGAAAAKTFTALLKGKPGLKIKPGRQNFSVSVLF
jgi:hypothetical protein